jgi:hypothetical protein
MKRVSANTRRQSSRVFFYDWKTLMGLGCIKTGFELFEETLPESESLQRYIHPLMFACQLRGRLKMSKLGYLGAQYPHCFIPILYIRENRNTLSLLVPGL